MSTNENLMNEIMELRNRITALEAVNATKPAIGEWKTYLPKLMGQIADPLLGDGRKRDKYSYGGPGQNGHYLQLGRLVVVKTWHQFSVGAKPGEGQYRMSLPVKAATGSDAWLGPTGVVTMHREETEVIKMAAVMLAHPDWVSFRCDDSTEIVSHNYPWPWEEGDGFNTFLIYEAAGDA